MKFEIWNHCQMTYPMFSTIDIKLSLGHIYSSLGTFPWLTNCPQQKKGGYYDVSRVPGSRLKCHNRGNGGQMLERLSSGI